MTVKITYNSISSKITKKKTKTKTENGIKTNLTKIL